MPANPYDFSNDATQRQHEALAARIEANPELLAIPLANIARWLEQGHDAAHRLRQWREIIETAQRSPEKMRELTTLLRDEGEPARHLKSYSPFAGVLGSGERRQIIKECASTR